MVNFRWTSLILSPHILGSRPYSFGISPWQTALAKCSRLSSSLFAFIPCVLGQPSLVAKPSPGFWYCWTGSQPCPSTWALPLVFKSEGRGSYARVLQCFTKGKHLPVLLMAERLAFQSREHPALLPCFKHLISTAVAKTFDHFPSEQSNSQNCFASVSIGKEK